MSDFCLGCGRYLDGNDLQCPECGRLTERAIEHGYVQQDDSMRNRGLLYLIMGILMIATAISMMVMR